MIYSCRNCASCHEKLEQYCENGFTSAYNGNQRTPTKENVTRGGFSEIVVVSEDYVLSVPRGYDLAAAAPLVCAGVTVYSPIKHWKVGKGTRVAIVGYGGLGHLALKFANAFGAECSVITTDVKHKGDLAIQNGAKCVIDSTDSMAMKAAEKSFDFILSTISVLHDVMPYVDMLKRDGVLCVVGAIGNVVDF